MHTRLCFMCMFVQAAELCHVIKEQNKMLCSLKELANHSQMQQLQVYPHIHRDTSAATSLSSLTSH